MIVAAMALVTASKTPVAVVVAAAVAVAFVEVFVVARGQDRHTCRGFAVETIDARLRLPSCFPPGSIVHG